MTTNQPIPLCTPALSDADERSLVACLQSGWVSSVGPFVDRFEERFAAFVGTPFAVACASGTAAIHLALTAAGVGPGDRVLCSDFTFIASANPIRYCGAEASFIDSERRSWNLDPAAVEAELERGQATGRPFKALVAVHIYGQPADLGPILRVCRRFDCILIEDAAESLGASYDDDYPDPACAGRHVGSIGDFGCFSFNGNKLITTGGGGMVTCNEEHRARLLKHLSTQAKQPGLGFVHDRIGFNYRMPNINAAIGLSQLDRIDGFLQAKRTIRARYAAMTEPQGWHLQPILPGTIPSAWMPCLYTEHQESLLQRLNDAQIGARPGWLPLSAQPAWQSDGLSVGHCAADLAAHTICLPCSVDLSEEDLERVIDTIQSAATP